MPRTITIDHVTRIEGHAKITIQLNDDGKVADTRFHVTQVRGFEKFDEVASGGTLQLVHGVAIEVDEIGDGWARHRPECLTAFVSEYDGGVPVAADLAGASVVEAFLPRVVAISRSARIASFPTRALVSPTGNR